MIGHQFHRLFPHCKHLFRSKAGFCQQCSDALINEAIGIQRKKIEEMSDILAMQKKQCDAMADLLFKSRDLIGEMAGDLESELNHRYTGLEYPSQKRRFDNDMAVVNEAKSLIETINKYHVKGNNND